MNTEVPSGSPKAVRRYRMWYAMLLRLYPRPFRERFGEGLAQTFHDLCRERSATGRGLFVAMLWIFCDTSLGIITENAIRMSKLEATRVALGALAVWMVPVTAAQFVEDWHWGLGGFAFVYILLFLTGMVIATVARRMSVWSYQLGVGLAVVAGFGLAWSTWVQAASLENPSNFWYDVVLVVGAIGAYLARLKAPGLAWTLFAMAAVLALLSVILPSGAPPDMARRMAIGHGVTTAMFVAAGFLFQHAGRFTSQES